jgi:hypothetical protein
MLRTVGSKPLDQSGCGARRPDRSAPQLAQRGGFHVANSSLRHVLSMTSKNGPAGMSVDAVRHRASTNDTRREVTS